VPRVERLQLSFSQFYNQSVANTVLNYFFLSGHLTLDLLYFFDDLFCYEFGHDHQRGRFPYVPLPRRIRAVSSLGLVSLSLK
jgi:hypothetical protein